MRKKHLAHPEHTTRTKPTSPDDQRPKVGRPSGVNAIVRDRPPSYEKFLQFLAAGSSLTTACKGSGLDYSQVKYWLEKGKLRKQGAYREFYDEVCAICAESAILAENSLKERNPELYIKMVHRSIYNEANPYQEPSTTTSIPTDNLPNPANNIDIVAVLHEFEKAGLITFTDSGKLLESNRPPSITSINPLLADDTQGTDTDDDES
jgi:hypothetical protein